MRPLNPLLYAALEKAFGEVKISNPGEPLCGDYKTEADGKQHLRVVLKGEYYVVRCCFCDDKSGHLYVNHRWGMRDPVNGTANLWLAHCFRCASLKEFDNRLILKDRLQSYCFRAALGSIDLGPIAAGPVRFQPTELLADFRLLSELERGHPARRFVASRKFAPDDLSRIWGVGHSESAYRDPGGRLVIPLRVPRQDSDAQDVWAVVGYQGRLLQPDDERARRYLTSQGTPRSQILYGVENLPQDHSPVIVCEGVTDVWRVGPGGVALLGKSIAEPQCRLLRRYASGRPIVVMLDPDAREEAEKVAAAIRRAFDFDLHSDGCSVVVAKLPAGKDPGECLPATIQEVVRRALASASPSPHGKKDAETTSTRIDVQGSEVEFQPWTPATGKIFAKTFAFACRTTPSETANPRSVPRFVLGAAFDGMRGCFVPPEHVGAFLDSHRKAKVVLHDAAFHLAVIDAIDERIGVYDRVEEDLVWDTQLLHRLAVLGLEGHAAAGKGESNLERCAEVYLGANPRNTHHAARGESLDLSVEAKLRKLARDAVVTGQVFDQVQQQLAEVCSQSSHAWGFVSKKWLQTQTEKWGPQTHHIQLRAAIVLRAISANGLHLDLARKDALAKWLSEKSKQIEQQLRDFGYAVGAAGSDQTLQTIFKRLEAERGNEPFPRTASGRYATSHDVLQELAGATPFVSLLLEFRSVETLRKSYLGKMARPVIHPSFDVLARSGRTTSFGEINAQNLPRDDRVRSCFTPSPGCVFVDADYKTVELATLAQACLSQFDLDSAMADAINGGVDLHAMIAARVSGKDTAAVTKDERQKAKPINLGKPGGMGNKSLQAYAKASFGIDMPESEVDELSRAWMDAFPEMHAFLADDRDALTEFAWLLELTPNNHRRHTGSTRFALDPRNIGDEDAPHAILGGMCLKMLKDPTPKTRSGTTYNDDDLDFLWSQLQAKALLFPAKCHEAIRQRKPSKELQRAVLGVAGSTGVLTLTGRLRANASYCARHNTIFQGLAADGAKLALWRLWRAGYRIANFIHDQVLVEVPRGKLLDEQARDIREVMIAGMEEVVPDVKIEVEVAASERWRKDAEAVYDESGRLVIWRPNPKNPPKSASKTKATKSGARKPAVPPKSRT